MIVQYTHASNCPALSFWFDVVFPAGDCDLGPRLDALLSALEKNVDAEFAAEVEMHIREEYSTYDWIMEGLLKQAGFRIDDAAYDDNFGAAYLCAKQ
ncbi:MAG: hypothetical protein JXB30_20510 [Anaerolineae bacterium]|nr:hypothetical protein [Anaerolineae bacterium]